MEVNKVMLLIFLISFLITGLIYFIFYFECDKVNNIQITNFIKVDTYYILLLATAMYIYMSYIITSYL